MILKQQLIYLNVRALLRSKNHTPWSFGKKTTVLILLLTVFRLVLAFNLELGNDEAYYWHYSQNLQWNYIDHPPMVAIWIRIFTLNLSFEQYEGFIRLGSIVGAALSTWFIFRATTLLHSERAGWMAAIMYQSSFYAGVTAGLYILPDSPQMVFWTMSLLMLARIIKNDHSWRHWLLWGLSTGICILCKVHGVFLWLGLGFFIIACKREWLFRSQLYLSLLITIIIILPSLLWNFNYNLVTLHLHEGRFGVKGGGYNLGNLVHQLGAQLLFANPLNAILMLLALFVWKKKNRPGGALIIYLFTSLTLILSILLASVFVNKDMPHWAGPAYVSLVPAAAIYLADASRVNFPLILKGALITFLLATMGWAFAVWYYPGTFGDKQKSKLGRGDITLDMYGWKQSAVQFAKIYRQDLEKGVMPANTALVTSRWIGAHFDYYFARPLKLPMIGLGGPQQVGQYLWSNGRVADLENIKNAYCIIPSDAPYSVPYGYFSRMERADSISVFRQGRAVKIFFVYRLRDLKKAVPCLR